MEFTASNDGAQLSKEGRLLEKLKVTIRPIIIVQSKAALHSLITKVKDRRKRKGNRL